MASEIAGNSQKETRRPEANFTPSFWGDYFINHNSDPQVIEKYSETIQVLKNEVRSILTAPGSKMADTMNLIDTLERLGISYHFENEIEEKLQQFCNLNTDYDEEAYDLCTTALHFRLFRQHGYRISCGIFGKWIDGNGKFQEGLKSDAKGLLSLYEASYLRIRGETILDESLDFATANLKSMAPNLGLPLRKQVDHALLQPLYLGLPRIESRNFISIYEEEEHKNETLLKFAKLDFSILQKLHQKELHEVSRWSKELDLDSKFPYTRDRLVEAFFWAAGVYYEPQYSRSRIMLTKIIKIMTFVDDTYDAHGTMEELDVFTEAMKRWDIGEIDKLPEYIKPLFKALLELYQQFEEELAEEGKSYAAYYAVEVFKELAMSYNVDAKWRIQGYLPSFEEYLNNGVITSAYDCLATSLLLGTESATKENFEWLSKKPKIIVSANIICRLLNDVGSYEVEKKRGQIFANGIDCYMNENGVTKEEAMAKFFEMALDAWKDTNEECLRPSSHSRDILKRILNLDRLVYVGYKDKGDAFAQPEVLKPLNIALFVDEIKI